MSPSQNCQYFTVSLSIGNKHAVLQCQGPGTPYTALAEISKTQQHQEKKQQQQLQQLQQEQQQQNTETRLNLIKMLDCNQELAEKISKLNLASVKHVKFSLDSDSSSDVTNFGWDSLENSQGEEVEVKLLLPPKLGFNNKNEKYPLVLKLSDNLLSSVGWDERFGVEWLSRLSSNKELVVATVNMGGSCFSQHRGGFTQCAKDTAKKYRRIIRHLLKSESYLSPGGAAIVGSGLGGYMAGWLPTLHHDNTTRCLVLDSPVTRWEWELASVSEKYLGVPGWQKYKAADLTNILTQNMGSRNLLLISSHSDTKVHVRHSLSLATKLVQAGKDFEQMIYTEDPRRNLRTNLHKHLVMEKFLLNCFN